VASPRWGRPRSDAHPRSRPGRQEWPDREGTGAEPAVYRALEVYGPTMPTDLPDGGGTPRVLPVRPDVSGRGLPLIPRAVLVGATVAVLAFFSGIALGTALTDGQPRPSPAPVGPTPTAPTTPQASTAEPAVTVPPGAYRLQLGEAYQVAWVADFFTAYNAGELEAVMRFLDEAPRLTDCDYRRERTLVVEGRAAVEAYIRDRFAEHDNWVVRLFNENPQNFDVVGVEPLQRQNDTLLALGVPGAVKRDFGIALSIVLASDHEHISVVGFGTEGASPGVVERLCRP
jgi:hypothetical protein